MQAKLRRRAAGCQRKQAGNQVWKWWRGVSGAGDALRRKWALTVALAKMARRRTERHERVIGSADLATSVRRGVGAKAVAPSSPAVICQARPSLRWQGPETPRAFLVRQGLAFRCGSRRLASRAGPVRAEAGMGGITPRLCLPTARLPCRRSRRGRTRGRS